MTDKYLEQYRQMQIDRVRESTRAIATKLRRLADDIEREADREDIYSIPNNVVHVAMWGFANTQIDGPARQLRELTMLDNGILTRNKKKIREAVDTWEADGDDEKLVNGFIDPFLNGEEL